MATTQRDVNLVIRAKDEASKAFDAIGAAINSIVGANEAASRSSTKTSQDLRSLTELALSLDKAYGKVSTAANNAGAAFERQQKNIDAQRASLEALKAQAQASAQAIDSIMVAIVDRSLSGGDTSPLIAQLKAAQTAAGQLDREVVKLTGSIAANEAQLDGQRSSLQQVGSLAIAAEQAQQQLANAVNQTTRAMQEQERATQVAPTIEAAIGLTRDRGEYDQLIGQIKAESEAHDQLIAKLRAEQEAASQLAETKLAQSRAALLLPGDATTGKSARDSASVFAAEDNRVQAEFEAQLQANAAAAKEMDAAAQRLRAQIDPLAQIQARLNVELAEANALYKAGRISAQELAAAEALLKANADKAAQALGKSGVGSSKPTLFGLSPYMITNLGYQINDVITQLASGTSLSQTMAQQGGQILQIFPKAGAAIVNAFRSPPLVAFGVVLSGIILSIQKLRDEENTVREFQATLDATADANEANAKTLEESAKRIETFGLKAKDAIAISKTFLSEGVNPARLIEFGEAAKNMADVMGIKVDEAAKKVAAGFTGSYASIRKLDQATNFLTLTERDHIKALFDEAAANGDASKAQEARNEAFRIFSERYEKAANDMRGPWAQAARELHNTWSAFLDELGHTELIEGMVNALDALGNAATRALHALNGGPSSNNVEQLQKNIQNEKDLIAAAQDPGLVAATQKQLATDTAELKRLQDAQKQGSDTAAQGTQAQAKATEDLGQAIDELKEKNHQLGDQERINAAITKARQEVQDKLTTDEFKNATDAKKAEYERLAVANARQEIEKKISDEKDAQNRKDEQAIRQFVNKVPAIEASGRTNASNPNSTALGLGQFTEDTWLRLFRKYFPDRAETMGRDAILALRKDSEVTKALVDAYARENAEVLKKAGMSVTEANLYLAHLLGIGGGKGPNGKGALDVLRASANTPLSSILPGSTIADNSRIMRGKTAGDLIAYAQDKTGDASAAVSNAEAHLAELEKERAATQAKFNKSLETEGDLRKQQIDEQAAQNKLQDTALIAEQRKAAVADAVAKLQKQVDDQNASRREKGQAEIQLTHQQKDAVAALAAAWFDVAHARDEAQAQTNEAMRPVNDLTAERDALRERIQQLMSLGDTAGADKLRGALDDVDAKLRTAIDDAITFYESLDPKTDPMHRTREQIDATIQRLKTAKTESKEWGQVMGLNARDIASAFANDLTNAVNGFFDKLQQGENIFQALGESVQGFAAAFLRSLAQMMMQLLAWAAAVEILRALGVPIPSGGGFMPGFGGGGSSGGGFNFAPTNHTGGIVGRNYTEMRAVSAAWFANATRYHTGGIAGLKPNEVPTILQRGEEVLTESDPRHRNNGGGKSAAPADRFRIVNLFDTGELLAHALSTRVGEKVILNHVRNNASAFNQALNGS